MNGPRTNQLVAPTSFITSISRRREKIESRIVFAISSAADVSRMMIAIRKIISITCAKCRIPFGVATLPSITLWTPGGRGESRLVYSCWMSSAFFGVTWN